MTWILYDILTGTILGHGEDQPTGYSTDKNIAQVNYLFWDAQPPYLYKYENSSVVVNDEETINLFIDSDEDLIIDESSNNFDVSSLYSNKTINCTSTFNATATLSSLDDFSEGDSIKFLRKGNYNKYLVLVPQNGEKIDGLNTLTFFGKGSVTIVKRNGEWFVSDRSNYYSWSNVGRSETLDFINTNSVTVTHDKGYIPRVDVWIEQSTNNYVLSVSDVIHDWDNMNEFTVVFNSNQTGKIVYS